MDAHEEDDEALLRAEPDWHESVAVVIRGQRALIHCPKFGPIFTIELMSDDDSWMREYRTREDAQKVLDHVVADLRAGRRTRIHVGEPMEWRYKDSDIDRWVAEKRAARSAP